MISRALDTLLTQSHPSIPARRFALALHAWVLAYLLSLLPAAPNFFGPHALPSPAPFDPHAPSHCLFRALVHPALAPYYPLVLALALFSSLFALVRNPAPLTSLVTFVCLSNLDARAWFSTDGGNRLITLFLPLAAFMNTDGTARPPVRTALANAAFFVARFQLCVVYFSAGLSKLRGTHWTDGSALARVFAHPAWSDGTVAPWLVRHPALLSLFTRATVAFELAFPLVLFVPRARVPILAMGVALHLGIAYTMGLVFFSLAMLCGYLLFLTPTQPGQTP